MNQLFLIAARSLWQHRTRTLLLGGAVTLVTALLIALTGLSNGMRNIMLLSATTLMSGHVNVGGFFKVTAGQAAPVVTDSKKVMADVRAAVPELDYVTERGRGWAKVISDSGSMQLGLAGINIDEEPGFRKVVVVREGSLDGLRKPGTILLFEEQTKKLSVKVGDRLTISAPTPRGTNNTVDVTLVAIAANIGMMSGWNSFLNGGTLRELYQLNDDTTGAVQLYLKDMGKTQEVQARLRKVLTEKGYGMMDNDPRAFWMKFETVNRENWTGQKLDVTNWEDEISFMKWSVDGLTALAVIVTIVLLVIIGVGIMNVMWITIRERTREIGTLRAIGMQRGGVLRMFLVEGFLLGLVGTVVGAAIGVALSAVVNAAAIEVPLAAQIFLMTDHLVLSPTVGWVVFAIVFVTLVITAVSLIPSFLAARMKPITAMSQVG